MSFIVVKNEKPPTDFVMPLHKKHHPNYITDLDEMQYEKLALTLSSLFDFGLCWFTLKVTLFKDLNKLLCISCESYNDFDDN
jgi:hypothetical protein